MLPALVAFELAVVVVVVVFPAAAAVWLLGAVAFVLVVVVAAAAVVALPLSVSLAAAVVVMPLKEGGISASSGDTGGNGGRPYRSRNFSCCCFITPVEKLDPMWPNEMYMITMTASDTPMTSMLHATPVRR